MYFILACPQKVVIVKSGEKDVEKRFLGYEFSNRRGNEGIHAIQRGKILMSVPNFLMQTLMTILYGQALIFIKPLREILHPQ